MVLVVLGHCLFASVSRVKSARLSVVLSLTGDCAHILVHAIGAMSRIVLGAVCAALVYCRQTLGKALVALANVFRVLLSVHFAVDRATSVIANASLMIKNFPFKI